VATPAAVDYLIFFEEPPVASRSGREAMPGKLDVNSSANRTYRANLLSRQDEAIVALEKLLSRPLPVTHRYTVATNGIAIRLSEMEAREAGRLPGIKIVVPGTVRFPQTDAGPAWIGAPDLWDGSQSGGLPGTRGEGILIGIIDTGINLGHPSFAGVGQDGYAHVNPMGAGNFIGFCASDPGHYQCNDKLIGVWAWPEVGNDPEDDYGHGSNVAGIAAGNVVTLTYQAPALVLTPTLSGVAPHANLIAYDVCLSGLGCPDTATLAAIDQALIDGVDVVNFSIGSPARDPWQDPVALAFLAARDAGVFVATSAGNGGPGWGSIDSPANAPWMTTAANSTHDARFDNKLLGLSGGAIPPPGSLTGSSITGGYGPAPIVYAAGYTNGVGLDDGRCAVSFPAGTWSSGEIVFCRAGGPSSGQKALNVAAGGAGGIVIGAETTFYQQLGIDRLSLPGMNLLKADADALQAWLSAGTGHTATINGTVRAFDSGYGDEIYSSSSRGPALLAGDVLKPNVAAPGTKIWAASMSGAPLGPPTLAFYTGTSQASPHVTGAAALLRALHPGWSVSEIESALMTTSLGGTVPGASGATPAVPFDVGAGRLDLGAAARAGLFLAESAVNFRAANPALGGQPAQLNLASLANEQCVQVCSWRRALTSGLALTVTWTITVPTPLSMTLTVSPSLFSLAPAAKQTITVTADVTTLPAGSWAFGEIRLQETSGLAPAAHLPVAARSALARLPERLQVDTRQNAGSLLIPGLQATGVVSLSASNYGLVPGQVTGRILSQDPTRSSPYDNLNDGTTFHITVTVPGGTRRLIAEILSSEAIDVELFVGVDGGDGVPQPGEEICASATPGWQEACDLLDPAPGLYWVLVQNWAESSAAPDAVSLATAVLPDADSLNSFLSGPLGMAVSGTFDLRFHWDLPALRAGEHWYGAFDIGSGAGPPGDLALVPVNLIRHPDEIAFQSTPITITVGLPATFTVALQPNVTPHDLTYAITATIPAGLSYVADSAAPPASVSADQLHWQLSLPKLEPDPVVLTYRAGLSGSLCAGTGTSDLVYRTSDPGSKRIELRLDTGLFCRQTYLPLLRKP
jgi:hypothetical protein